jgi:hypothetical protein
MVNLKQNQTHDVLLAHVFDGPMPSNAEMIRIRIEEFLELTPGTLSGYTVSEEPNGNVLARPQSTFGMVATFNG